MLGLYWKAVRQLGLRHVLERLRRLGLLLAGEHGCEVCGNTYPYMFPFMVSDDLWEEVVGEVDAELCLHCFEVKMAEKIDRPLLPSDFTNCPMNKPILMMLRIARRGGLS